jgi:aminoglycoside phosphotransferase (APT) family kinase protein
VAGRLDAAPAADPRCHPWIHLEREQLQAMLRPLLGNARLRAVSRVDGGLVNTTYRVIAGDSVYAVRVYASGEAAFEAERRLLAALAGTLPVPEPLYAAAGGRSCAHPFVVYRWIDGITLNDLRRRAAPGELLPLAEPVGRLAARIAGTWRDDDAGLPVIQVAEALESAERQLRSGLGRARLGEALADSLRERLAAAEPRLLAAERSCGLVHGDFGGRNVLVRAGDAGREISGVLDWETAAHGAALWDVGSLFRYPRRYPVEFVDRFAHGYRAAGGELGRDWRQAARLLDATRLVGTLGEEREFPNVFAECRDLITSMLAGESFPAP